MYIHVICVYITMYYMNLFISRGFLLLLNASRNWSSNFLFRCFIESVTNRLKNLLHVEELKIFKRN